MGDLAFQYVQTIVLLLKKAGIDYTDQALGSGVSYSKVLDIAKGDSERISTEIIKKIEEYAQRVLEEDK